MQIFSLSPIPCSSHRKKKFTSAGFTLIELLICCAIITIVSAVVLVKYKAFDSTVLLKGTAYDIALTLRDAQVKSVSVLRNDTNFDYPYGVTFDVSDATERKRYKLFRYADGSPTSNPHYDFSESDPDLAEDIQTFTIGRTMRVKELCYTYPVGTADKCDLTRLDISFRRPDFNAIFYATDPSNDPVDTTAAPSVTGAKIKVDSTGGTAGVFVVTITKFGQISVSKE